MALPTGAQSSGGRIIDSDGVEIVRIQGPNGTAALVGSVPPSIVVDPDTGYDADGNLVAWTQDGVAYTATYDSDGNLLTQGPA